MEPRNWATMTEETEKESIQQVIQTGELTVMGETLAMGRDTGNLGDNKIPDPATGYQPNSPTTNQLEDPDRSEEASGSDAVRVYGPLPKRGRSPGGGPYLSHAVCLESSQSRRQSPASG